MQVGSFGVNGHVKLPGPTQQQPNVYNFGTPYEVIYNDLRSKDEGFYEQKGLLQVAALSLRACARRNMASYDNTGHNGDALASGMYCPLICHEPCVHVDLQMLRRNMSIKPAPQRWQDNQEPFDVVVVFEERLMDNLLEG